MLEIASISTQISILVFFGILSRWLHFLDENGRDQVSNLVFNVTLPCMLFTTAAKTNITDISGKAALCFAAGIFVPVLAYGIGQLAAILGREQGAQRQVIRVGAALSNTAFFGIPICTMLWGPEAGLLASIYDQGITIPMFILGPIGYSATPNMKSIRKAIINPMILSMLAGFLINLLHVNLPVLLTNPLTMIGNITGPLALILVGSLVDFALLKQVSLKPLLLFTSSRLLIVPMAIFMLAVFFTFETTSEWVIVMQAAMPPGVVATLMAFEYGSDQNLAIQGNMLSVILSPVTLALFAALIDWKL